MSNNLEMIHDLLGHLFWMYLSYLFILLYNIPLVLPYIDLNLPWDGEGGGRGVQNGEHMYTHGYIF